MPINNMLTIFLRPLILRALSARKIRGLRKMAKALMLFLGICTFFCHLLFLILEDELQMFVSVGC